jgi:hypothetical protein
MLADFVLKRGPLLTGAIRRLDGRLRKSGVQALLSKANRKLMDKGCAEDAAVPRRAKVYCFEPGDNKDGRVGSAGGDNDLGRQGQRALGTRAGADRHVV